MGMHRLPPWLRTRLPSASCLGEITGKTYLRGLRTVCREARCPNEGECSSRREATFLILGDTCTRNCGFCAVKHGLPEAPDPDESTEIARSVTELGLKHAVVTSVTRDDLPDGGAAVFAATIREIRSVAPRTTVEVLIPDFRGNWNALDIVADAKPDVLNHNLETVPRLYGFVRQGASYQRSLELLRRTAALDSRIITKSGLMVGLGETRQEIAAVVKDLVDAGCTALTVGQYLRPTPQHLPVRRFVPPEEFAEIRSSALSLGMIEVAAGPLVRSSYKAGEILAQLRAGLRD
ncbi:MAG TPA: lipoyl synthase [Desulfomonilaceae bacterium]|nr:lipoyl synthase [Desulfomonilaceae bacterium]